MSKQSEAQATRTRRASEGQWEITPAGESRWDVVNLDGASHTVARKGEWGCDCPDFVYRCAGRGLKCKHIEAIRLGLDGPNQSQSQTTGGSVMTEKTTATTATIEKAIEQLSSIRFPLEVISWKPQVTTKDKTRGMGVPYASLRAYEDTLNAQASKWSSRAEFVVADGKVGCVVSLTIAGVVRVGDGEQRLDDDNVFTSAYAQAFKRAASRFGLGRYLYDLPGTWADYDAQARKFTRDGYAELDAVYAQFCSLPAPTATGRNGRGNSSSHGRAKSVKNPDDPASQSQMNFIYKLMRENYGYTEDRAKEALRKKGYEPGKITKGQASELIDLLKNGNNDKKK